MKRERKMKRRKATVLLGVLVSCIAITTGCGSSNKTASKELSKETNDEKVIRVGVNHTGEPYVFTKDKKVTGFEGDMWKEISKRTGLKVEYSFNSIASLFGLLDNGQIDTVAHFLGKTPERAEKYDFSNIYSSADLKVLIHSDSKEFEKVEDMYGKKIAILSGSAAATTVEKIDPDKKIDFVMYEDTASAIQDVDMKRVDGFYSNGIALAQTVRKMQVNCKTNPLPIFSTKVAYPFRQGDANSEKLMKQVNKAIEEMLEDGTIKKISEKWLFIDTTTNLGE